MRLIASDSANDKQQQQQQQRTWHNVPAAKGMAACSSAGIAICACCSLLRAAAGAFSGRELALSHA
jgi:hypothetical protein